MSAAAVDDDAKEVLTTEGGMLPGQIYLLDKLMTWPTSMSLEDEWKRRSEAINAITAYCRVEEGGPREGGSRDRIDTLVSWLTGEKFDEEAQSRLSLNLTRVAPASGGEAGGLLSMFWKLKAVNINAHPEIPPTSEPDPPLQRRPS